MTWIFGYGSLMWRPGFEYQARTEATLHGFHRGFCVFSHVHRGTPEVPGLVLGLDRGGSCKGIAYQVAEEHWPGTLSYLRAREQATMIYLERDIPIRLKGGAQVRATTYIVDRTHRQYAGRLSLEEQIRLVRQGVGQSGANPEYVINAVAHLEAMGMAEGPLHDLHMALMAGPAKTN